MSSKARLNVLLYGSHESGRSSFLNACFTLFSKERRVLAVSHTGGSHETAGVLKMERYRLCCIDAASGRLQGHMGSQLCLFDTKCSADPATSAANLAQILKGVDFFKPAKGAAVPMTSKRAKPQPKLTTTMHMHCVAVFLPAAEMAAPTVGPQAVQMREFVATCSKAGIMSIVCLSKADVVDSAFCEDPCHPSPVLAAARAKAAAFFAVAEAQVLLHSASKYLTEWSKHFESDRNTYRVIAECQKIASAHLLRAKAMSEV